MTITNNYSLCIYQVLDTLHRLSPLVIPIILRGRSYYYTHFTDEQTEIRKVTQDPTDRPGIQTQALQSMPPASLLANRDLKRGLIFLLKCEAGGISSSGTTVGFKANKT